MKQQHVLCGLAAAVLVTILFGLAPIAAQQPGAGAASQPRIDKGLGEEEQIRLRREWFYSTRRAGASSDTELWSLRLAAVMETRQAIAAQRERRASGFEDAQNVWVEMGPSPSTFGGWAFGTVSGRIQAIAADWNSGTLYAGAASGGVWKSTNEGLSWESIFDSAGSLAVGAITVDPYDPDVLWVGTGDNIFGCESYFGIGLLRSDDGGQTWELRNGSGGSSLQDLSSFASIVLDPRDTNRIVTGGSIRNCSAGNQLPGGIFTTDDGGLSWTNRLSNTEIYEIQRDPEVLDVLWAGTSSGVYKSVDNGVNWALQSGNGLPAGNVGRCEIAVSPSDPNTVYALFSNTTTFWRTTDGGATWTMMSSGSNACDGQCWYNMVLRVHRTNRDIVYRGTIRIFKTLNGGSSWSNLTNTWGSSQQVHQDTHSLLMHPTDTGTFYVGSDGGLWKSSNGGSSFQNLNGNMNVTQFYAIGVDANDPARICGGAQDNSSLARSNSNVWDRQAVTGDGFVCHIDPLLPNYAYITSYPSGGYPNVWRSQNGLFGNFSDITGPGSGIIGGDSINWVTPYILDPVNPEILYLGTNRVYRSNNRGNSWTHVGPSNLTGGSGSLLSLEVNRNFPSYVYSGSASGRLWRTTDGGSAWFDLTTGLPSNRSINDIGADPTNRDRAFAVVGGFNTAHLWEWINGVPGWAARGTGLPNVPANTVLMLTDTDILVGNDVGVFRSYDGGQNFVPFMDGLPEGLVVTDLKLNELQGLVTVGSYARGAWQMTVDPLQPILLADSVEQPLVEVDGDADGQIEPGETWSVRPIVRNAGGQTALDVSATLFSATPGVTILEPSGSYGDLGPGVAATVQTPHRFIVDPTFDCGNEIVFDLLDASSSNPPGEHSDQPAFFTAQVQDGNAAPTTSLVVDETFDTPPNGWTHEAVISGLPGCFLVSYTDHWQLATKDVEHGQSYHCGNGPGNNYSQTDFAWLHSGGKDSEDGPGLVIPADAIGATLTLVHWYDTVAGEDGGQVVIDGIEDDQDVYIKLKPVGGYPGSLETGSCNGLEGQDAFQGSSGGWITSQFDLMQYKGRPVYLAFVFGSDNNAAAGEGWYIDQFKVEYQQLGAPLCDVAAWPGEVATAQFELLAPDSIEATWDDSCNLVDFPGQTYSIQVGDLDALRSSGSYTHQPLDGLCDQTAAASFTPGAGNEYYLIVPAGDGREGGAGTDSAGVARPQPTTVCGERRVACP